MRKFYIAIALIALLFAGCIPIPFTLTTTTATASSTPLPTTCNVYEVKSFYDVFGFLDGSFGQFPASDSGVNVWILIDKTLIDFIKWMNTTLHTDSIFSFQKMYEGKNGTVYGNYYRIVDASTDPNVKLGWNWVAPTSADERYRPTVKNYVCIDRIAGGYAYIVGVPKTTDYSIYLDASGKLPDYLDWSIMGNWAGSPTLWHTIPVQIDTFPLLAGKSDKTFRIPVSDLGVFVRNVIIPWRAQATNTPIQQIFTPTNTPDLSTPTFTPSPTFTPVFGDSVTPTRTPECHLVPFENIDNTISVCIP